MLGSDIAVSVLFGLVLPDRQSICAQSLQSFELLCSYLAEWDAKPSIPVVHLGRHLLTLFVPRRSPITCLFHLSIQRWMQRNISLDTSLKWMSHLSLQQLSCLLLPHQAIVHRQPISLSPTCQGLKQHTTQIAWPSEPWNFITIHLIKPISSLTDY